MHSTSELQSKHCTKRDLTDFAESRDQFSDSGKYFNFLLNGVCAYGKVAFSVLVGKMHSKFLPFGRMLLALSIFLWHEPVVVSPSGKVMPQRIGLMDLLGWKR